MGLSDRLLRAAGRPHVLVATAPGGTATRLAVEAAVRRRGWPAVANPADADVLVVAGTMPAHLVSAVDEVWAGLPAPSTRIEVDQPGLADECLGRARAVLLAGGHALERAPGSHVQGGANDMAKMDMAPMDMGDMDMGDMDMPAGLPMAERADDRDGLKLDQLHLSLGPLLADWPSGLALHLTLQGDVVQEATAEAVGVGSDGSFWDEPWERVRAGGEATVGEAARRRACSHLDSLGRLLAVAGWPDAAVVARLLRDDLLGGAPRGAVSARFDRLARRVGRSRVLAWMTGGLGGLDAGRVEAFGVGGPAARTGGDVTARYRCWLAETAAAVDVLDDGRPLGEEAAEGPRGRLDRLAAPSRALLDAAETLVAGAEVGAARLIVASLDPDVDELAFRPLGRLGD